MNTTVISGRLVRNPGYNEVENEKGLHKINRFPSVTNRRKVYLCTFNQRNQSSHYRKPFGKRKNSSKKLSIEIYD